MDQQKNSFPHLQLVINKMYHFIVYECTECPHSHCGGSAGTDTVEVDAAKNHPDCQDCGRVFKNKRSLATHRSMYHTIPERVANRRKHVSERRRLLREKRLRNAEEARQSSVEARQSSEEARQSSEEAQSQTEDVASVETQATPK